MDGSSGFFDSTSSKSFIILSLTSCLLSTYDIGNLNEDEDVALALSLVLLPVVLVAPCSFKASSFFICASLNSVKYFSRSNIFIS